MFFSLIIQNLQLVFVYDSNEKIQNKTNWRVPTIHSSLLMSLRLFILLYILFWLFCFAIKNKNKKTFGQVSIRFQWILVYQRFTNSSSYGHDYIHSFIYRLINLIQFKCSYSWITWLIIINYLCLCGHFVWKKNFQTTRQTGLNHKLWCIVHFVSAQLIIITYEIIDN